MGIHFTKMSGSGNDFIIIDNRVPVIENAAKQDFVHKICEPKTSVGADGVIFVERSDKADLKWDFINADGSLAEMCGNGARCVARYAFEKKITPANLSLETLAGIITAEVKGNIVKVKLTPPEKVTRNLEVKLNGVKYKIDSINTGVPHAIIYSDNVEEEDVSQVGRGIRYHEAFSPAGTNVDFVQRLNGSTLKVRTYERGVEDETLACGTGVVASALAACEKENMRPPIDVETRGGEILKVHFQPATDSFGEVYLEGSTKMVFEGTLLEL